MHPRSGGSGSRPPWKQSNFQKVAPRPEREGTVTISNRTATKKCECEIREGKVVDIARLVALFGLAVESVFFEPSVSRGGILMEGDLISGGQYIICGDDLDDDENTAQISEAVPPCKVALGYSELMLQHIPSNDRIIEAPRRLTRIVDALMGSRVLLRHFPEKMFCIPVRLATSEEIYRVHKRDVYQKFIEAGEPLDVVPTDVYFSPGSRDAVLAAAGITVEGARLVAKGEFDSAFCVVRPPGHHCADVPNGFCLVNNVVIAVRDLLVSNPSMRIAIVDCDAHHGDGTQQLVEADDRIMYISMHRYDKGQFFPRTGHLDSVGATGQCINVPFDCAPLSVEENGARTISDHCFEEVTKFVVIPALERFNADIVFLSCGFDVSDGDPLVCMGVVNGYSRLIAGLKALPAKINGRRHLGLVCVLEGGYNPKALTEGSVLVASALVLGSAELPCVDPPIWQRLLAQSNAQSPTDLASLRARHAEWVQATIQRVRAKHKKYFD